MKSPARVYIRCVFGLRGVRRTATGQCAGLMPVSMLQLTPAEGRISQAEFKRLFAAWFNAGNPVEPSR